MHHFSWQLYWTRWHLSFERVPDVEPGYWSLWDNYLFIGPLQIRWWSERR